MEARSDRELMIEMNGNIKMLAGEINHLAESITALESNRILPVEKRVTALEKWQNKMDGGWKAVIVITGVLALVSTFTSVINALRPEKQPIQINGHTYNPNPINDSSGSIYYSSSYDDLKL